MSVLSSESYGVGSDEQAGGTCIWDVPEAGGTGPGWRGRWGGGCPDEGEEGHELTVRSAAGSPPKKAPERDSVWGGTAVPRPVSSL